MEISKTIESLAISAVNVTTSQHELSQEIHSIDQVTKEIESVLKDITRAANNTKLIGFNAAIEAARLGNEGRGFAVVANEIQTLAENSKETAAHIAELNKQINGKLDSTVQNSEKTLSITEEQSAAMEELSATVQAVTELAGRLKDLFQIK
ncbi:methyl-accepting chemotaxis protein [Aminipila terrae]|uniref:Methyl-accepting chemotaxis protein n=1 Tax=Aminipila terrae TaxID=2697030 RepID=A0A6P1MCN3_9FIRM|nr:methyl-accepting chemotaxis protein [Aminipila terrae]QHI72469.1 methyl-accepting chemotaxis protein [Aminipila terrae]